ncbi:ABC transporter ATP-binding protein [Methylomagnum sp.]
MTLLVLSKFVRWAVSGMKSLGKRKLGLSNELSQSFKETQIGIRTIRAFGREAYEIERFGTASLASHRLETKQERLVSLAHPLSEGLAAMALMGMVFLALRTGLSLPVLATVVFMMFRLLPQIQSVNTQFATILARNAVVESVLDLMDSQGKPYPRAGTGRFGGLVRDIRLEHVSFAYRGKAGAALESVDLEIPKGQTIAFVGPSGAGKSTLIHLLCRFYEPTRGRILADGRDVAEFDLASWRERIALVSQDVHIFSTTVRDNIAYGRLGAGEADIIAAAQRAHAHDFIMALPQGYDTLVGDRGLLLSGGQRQRLSIARAMLRDPDILILDEATNALDPISEAHIQAAIEELGQSRTVLVVAHRLSTIERADRIVVLDQGRIAEQGRFAELLARGGLFAGLYRSHRLGIADGAEPAPPLLESPP